MKKAFRIILKINYAHILSSRSAHTIYDIFSSSSDNNVKESDTCQKLCCLSVQILS